MTWFMRLGALCAVLCAVACTGNPKPLPPNEARDSDMPPQDANASPDGTVYQDASGPGPDASSDGAVNDAGDGAVEGGSNDGGPVGDSAVDGGDAGLFVLDGSARKKDSGPRITPPPPQD